MIRATLYDAAGDDREVQFASGLLSDLGDDRLLWLDLVDPSAEDLQSVASALGLDSVTLRRADESEPALWNHPDYLHVHVAISTSAGPPFGTFQLSVIAGANYVLTLHKAELDFLNELAQQIRGETNVGALESAALLAGILDRQIASYLVALDALERRVDAIDTLALNPRSSRDLAADLLEVRRALGQLRRGLAAHREVYADLTRPELLTIASSNVAPQFEALRGRFFHALESLESGRDMVVSSFDLYMMRTAQRTNEIMKLLTVVSVVLLPSVVVAGVMGMNFQVGLFDRPELFWIVLAGMGLLAIGALALARLRGWL